MSSISGRMCLVRVVVVGAGIGGLALAHGLQRLGADVVVLERDTELRRTVGHGLLLDRHALAALDTMLPVSMMRTLDALGQGTWVETGYRVLDDQGRPIADERPAVVRGGLVTDRVTLRLLLSSGLDDALRLGAGVIAVERHRSGGAMALLADGSRVRADLVVAADGVGSPIASGLAGRPTSSPTPLIGFAGWTGRDALSEPAAQVYGDRPSIAVGLGGHGLYAGLHHALDPALVRTFSSDPLHVADEHVWGAVMLESAQTSALTDLSGVELVDGLVALLEERDWSTELVEMIARSDPATVSGFGFHAAPSDVTALAPWQAGVITAVGDAVHAMPPTGGRGASTAIRDAETLCDALAEVMAGRASVVDAVGRYESTMREYAAQVVFESRRPPPWSVTRGGTRWLPSARDTSLAAAAVAWAQREPRAIA